MITFIRLTSSGLFVAMSACFVMPITADADTIGYWRFEGGVNHLNDSGQTAST